MAPVPARSRQHATPARAAAPARAAGRQAISKPYGDLAQTLAATPTTNPQEVGAGLRKLLEAKDCAVRAALAAPKN